MTRFPAQWRSIELYQRQPLLLARDARYHAEGTIQGLRDSYRTARADIAAVAEPMQLRKDGGFLDREAISDITRPALDAYLQVHAREGARRGRSVGKSGSSRTR